MPIPARKSNIRLVQMSAAQSAPAAEPKNVQRFNLGQDFVLEVGNDKQGRYLETVSTLSGKDVSCPHLLSQLAGSDLSGNRIYIGVDHDLRAALIYLRRITCYTQNAPAQMSILKPAVACIA